VFFSDLRNRLFYARAPPRRCAQSQIGTDRQDQTYRIQSQVLWSVAVQLQDFQYVLPPERIAQHPSEQRDNARLLELPRKTGAATTEARIYELVDRVQEGDVWVVNNTRVRPARVMTTKPTGGRVELLIVRIEDTVATAMYRSSKPLKPGQQLTTVQGGIEWTILDNLGGGYVTFELNDQAEHTVAQVGQIPLPPYIDRPPAEKDQDRYQTVYAEHLGAVAAPTAGLHFTHELIGKMEARGARFAQITLHVGPGTFRPIRSEAIEDHILDSERYEVDEQAADIISNARRVVAVGTTVVRTLEALAQSKQGICAGEGETNLYITPGYNFRVVDALLTNFHLPGSSLLVLVSAFAGRDRVMKAYQQALDESFRFYSYGDAMFIS